MSTGAGRRVPEAARELAGRLAELFARDRDLVLALNTAQDPPFVLGMSGAPGRQG